MFQSVNMDMVKAAALFGSNPFSSPVGQQIERATDPLLASEDWTLILEVCDIINETDEGPKDAIRALRKRISSQKNYKSVLYALTLTEACVKNCGTRFHKHIASKEFLNDMTKLLGPKGQSFHVPQVVQEKVLSLIQSWCDAFRNAPDLQGIKLCYDSLRTQGYEFPAQDLDKLSPIFTPSLIGRESEPSPQPASSPPVSTPLQTNGARQRTFAPPRNSPQGAGSRPVNAQAKSTAPINPTTEQLSKLRSELDIVEGNAKVLSEMLTQLIPGQESSDDYELLVELNKTCREMQKRVQELIDRVVNEEVTGVLLRVNDNLNNIFIRYDRHERNRKGLTGEITPEMVPTPMVESTVESMPGDNLMEFDSYSPPAVGSLPSKKEDDEFDIFAQSRTLTDRDSGSTYEDNIKGVPNEGTISDVISARGPYPPPTLTENGAESLLDVKEKSLADDIEDVEVWLKGTDLAKLEAAEKEAREIAAKEAEEPRTIQTSEAVQPMSSSEFDKFLSERATKGSVRVETKEPAPPPPRQMKNVISGEKASDEMYAL